MIGKTAARLVVVAGLVLLAGAVITVALPLFADRAILRNRFVDVATYLLLWGFILLAPFLGVLGLVLGKGQRQVRLLAAIELIVWGIAVVLMSFVHM